MFSGLPQGSALALLLFLVYINDTAEVVKFPIELKLFLDCFIYSQAAQVDDQIRISQALHSLVLWCEKWDTEINYTRQTFQLVTNKKILVPFSYNIENKKLKIKDTFKHLGVTKMHTLHWHKHTDNVCLTTSQTLHFLRKKLEHATKILTAYNTFICTSLEYACVVWSPTKKF